jgi:hypothetical protein
VPGLLVWRGARQEIGIRDDPARFEVAWDGEYELLGDFFRVDSEHPEIGERAIAGYPLEAVRKLLDRAQSFQAKFDAVTRARNLCGSAYRPVHRNIASRPVRRGSQEAAAAMAPE